MTKRDTEMVGIVKGVKKILMERVNVLKTRETVEDLGKLLGEGLLGKFDLSGVESCSELVSMLCKHKSDVLKGSREKTNL